MKPVVISMTQFAIRLCECLLLQLAPLHMTLKSILIFAGSLCCVACNSSENSRVGGNDASGVYAKEYSSEVTHPEPGNKIGIKKIRDSIFGLIGDRIYSENYKGEFQCTPVFIGTSNPDPHVPVERVQATTTLKGMNAVVTEKIYDGFGHTISEDEMDQANKLVFKL